MVFSRISPSKDNETLSTYHILKANFCYQFYCLSHSAYLHEPSLCCKWQRPGCHQSANFSIFFVYIRNFTMCSPWLMFSLSIRLISFKTIHLHNNTIVIIAYYFNFLFFLSSSCNAFIFSGLTNTSWIIEMNKSWSPYASSFENSCNVMSISGWAP